MKASLRYVSRNLGRRRGRTWLGVLGIFLTLALLTAIQIGLDSVSSSYTDLVALQAGKADLMITAHRSPLLRPVLFAREEVERKLAGHPRLRGLAPRLLEIAQVSSPQHEQAAFLIGLDLAREKELEISGLSPEPVLSTNGCALSEALAKRLKAERGSRVTVRFGFGGESLELEVASVVRRQLILPQEVRDFVVVNEATARTLLGEPERVHFLAGALRNASAYYDARDLHQSVLRLKEAGQVMAGELGLDYDVTLPKASALAAFQNFAAPLRALFGVFALLALSVTGLLIYSILSVAVEERIREYGILRAVGAKQREIFRLVLGEAFLLCFLGVVPGVGAGMLVAQGVVRLVELALRSGGEQVRLTFSGPTLGLTLLVGTALAVGSALVPAWQAVRWRIVDALDPFRRGQIRAEPRPEGSVNRPLVLTGLVLSVLSIVIFFVLPPALLSGNPSLIGTVVLCLLLMILLGFTLSAVGVLPLLERVVMAGTRWAFGPSSELAQRNLVRHRRRNTTTAVMFVLSVSLVIFIASLVVLFSRTSMIMVEHFNGADLRLQSGAMAAEDLRSDLAGISGVAAVSEVRSLHSRSSSGVAYDVVISDLVGMRHLWVVPFGVDADLAKVLYTRRVQYDEGDEDAITQVSGYQVKAGAPGEKADAAPPVILSTSAARYLDVRRGDLVQLTFQLGTTRREARFRVEAVCGAMPGFSQFRSRVANAVGSGFLMPMASFREMTAAVPDEMFQVRYFLKTAPDEPTHKTVARTIRENYDVRYQFGVKSVVEQKQSARVLYWVTQVFFGLLLSVAVVIAVFALMASMASAALERRWEIGMLKALGLRRSQLFRMFLGEAVVLTVSAGIAGGAIGFVLAYMFVLEAGALVEIPIVFAMPYLIFFITFAISVVAGAVAAHLPTRRLLRKPAAEILRMET